MDWVHAIGVFIGVGLGPSLGKLWNKIDEFDQRRIDKAYEREDAKKALKAEKIRYTSATVLGPLRIGHERDAGSDGARGSESR